MDSASETLLIVVSSTLTVFLIAFSVALIYLIRLLKQLGRIAQKAENVADSVESAAHTIEKAASPMAAVKLVGSIIDQASKFRNKKG